LDNANSINIFTKQASLLRKLMVGPGYVEPLLKGEDWVQFPSLHQLV